MRRLKTKAAFIRGGMTGLSFAMAQRSCCTRSLVLVDGGMRAARAVSRVPDGPASDPA
jgi:hypothetical protein